MDNQSTQLISNLDIIVKVTTIILGTINIIFVYLVYTFHKKDKNSNLSFSFKLKNVEIEKFKINEDYGKIEEFLEKFSEKEKKKYYKYLKLKHIPREDHLFGIEVFKILYDATDFKKIKIKGLSNQKHDKQLLILTVTNTSPFPATSIDIQLKLKIKRSIWETGIDEADIKNVSYEDYRTIKCIKHFDYFPANTQEKVYLYTFKGEFTKAELYINKAKSAEMKYIKKQIKVFDYLHKDLVDCLVEDSPHYRRIIGAQS